MTNPVQSIAGLIVLAGLSVLPVAQAVSPPPDGDYPGANTAEGEDALFSLAGGTDNTAVGFQALFSDTNGGANTAIGSSALGSNTLGNANTATGRSALSSNTTGDNNTATGDGVLNSNTTGSNNTAAGRGALGDNTTGDNNTAMGADALSSNTTGAANTAVGFEALNRNVTGSDNTAVGSQALLQLTTGMHNTACGSLALALNTEGEGNTGLGFDALNNNTIGGGNTATGSGALFSNTSGSSNTSTGLSSLIANTTGSSNTAHGLLALGGNTTGSNNIALGVAAGLNLTTGDQNIDIGNSGVAGESNTIRIGTAGNQTATYIAGIRNSGLAVATAVGITTDGRLGVRASSKLYKNSIKPMSDASEAILSLQPVSFLYKKELDPKEIPQFGLVAEEVARISPDLVIYDEEGRPFTVRYDAVNAMLLNEFLKEHQKGAARDAIIARLQAALVGQSEAIAALTKRLEAQAAQLREVNEQLELNRATPLLVTKD